MAKKTFEKPVRKPPSSQAQAKAETKPAEPAKKAAPTAATTAPKPAPLIDTSRAANTAAAMVGNKWPATGGGGTAPPKKESAAFKQFKAGLNKPAAGALGGAFGIAGQQKKSHLPHAGGKQVGRNQTFGADVNRAGVPRRTPG